MTQESSPLAFLDQPTGDLRQGDICFSWPFPKWQMTSYQVTSSPAGPSQATALVSLHEQGTDIPLVICSHDCDLENPRGRLGFIVAPLFPWPSGINITTEKGLTLVNSYKPGPDNSYDHINLYPIKLPGEDPEWRVVEFSAMTSISPPLKLVPILRKAKRFEMTDEAREYFGTKLAAFFIR